MPQRPVEPPQRGFLRGALLILWPAFLMAGVLEVLVFAFVDPATLHWFGSDRVDVAPGTVYSVAFFIFWCVTATSGAITRLLEIPVPGPFDR